MQIMINTRSRQSFDTTPKPSIYLMSPWTHPADGWAIATRAYARALHESGRGAIQLYDTVRPHAEIDPHVAKEMAWMRPHDVIDLIVWSGMLEGAETMVPRLRKLAAAEAPVGLYLVFERQSLEPELVDALARFPIWVQSRTNERVLHEHGLRDVTYIPYPWFQSERVPTRPNREKPEDTRFYWIGRFEPRKAPGRLILAFLEAFKPGDPVHLTLKCSPLGYSFNAGLSPDRSMLEGLLRFPQWSASDLTKHITVVEEFLSDRDMLGLHLDSDVYVSPSRGEGLELGAWQAKQCANLIITTQNGGADNYIDPDIDILIPSKGLVAADPRYKWGRDATYIEYDQKLLIQALRRAALEPDLGSREWPGWEEHDSIKVGNRLADWAESIIK